MRAIWHDFCYDTFMTSENILSKAKNIHFIGIGGIGISAIARMLLLEGKNVSGSDRDDTKVTQELAKAGAKFFVVIKKKMSQRTVIFLSIL